MARKSLGRIVLAIILGALIGSLVGQLLGLLLPDSVVREFFLRSASLTAGPALFDLGIFSLTLGFSFELNIAGVLGIAVAIYLLRWYF